jgi:hypothetical protein
MTTILQLRAQFESLANQYATNEDEAAMCATRRDEGNLSIVFRIF